MAAVVLAAVTAIGLAGCGSATSSQSAPTTKPGNVTTQPNPAVSQPNTVEPTNGRPAPDATVVDDNGPTPGATTVRDDQPAPPVTTVKNDNPAPPVTTAKNDPAGPYGSGHGLCFDLNSQLAADATARLAVPAVGSWQNPYASDDPISAGCDGVLSWMTVESGNIHPYVHVLFFTGGTYLGTATLKPHGYTQVIGKTRNTVTVQYKWAKDKDALCCPTGGPTEVTFTLKGRSVSAKGEFPPDN
ncbi:MULTISPECIES: LppP/LprE family lipoprotein [unclassified Nocardia]|uniref:LppP/LprE family lipoprotein n=1 Tax=unclassified Nocardia TaxID=2637762 RepID=UPI001CE3F72B|nr:MULTISPECIES: LppP/LprE family lipoprotein [unclassified Nocardia]